MKEQASKIPFDRIEKDVLLNLKELMFKDRLEDNEKYLNKKYYHLVTPWLAEQFDRTGNLEYSIFDFKKKYLGKVVFLCDMEENPVNSKQIEEIPTWIDGIVIETELVVYSQEELSDIFGDELQDGKLSDAVGDLIRYSMIKQLSLEVQDIL